MDADHDPLDRVPMDLRTALRTTGAVRSFEDRPVADEVIASILDDARFAPSGGNRQGWRIAVVRDPALRTVAAAHLQSVWDEYAAIRAVGATPFSTVDPGVDLPDGPFAVAANPLVESIQDIPVVLMVAVDLALVSAMDAELDRVGVTAGASVYPFCWSVLLSARAHGLGGVLTTFLSRAEPAVAEAFGLPPTWALCGTIFLGHPVHQPTRLSRRPVEAFTTLDRFDGPTFQP
ncbi:MAG: nitroreductase family protein [Ilumatobacteraceae bacterium]